MVLQIVLSLLLVCITVSSAHADDSTKQTPEVSNLIRQLNDDHYKVREKASQELSKIALLYLPFLKKVRQEIKSLEARERLDEILEDARIKLYETIADTITKSVDLLDKKKYTEALDLINTALKIAPEHKQALEIKLKILETLNKYTDCIELLEKMLKPLEYDSEESENIYFKLSQLYTLNKNYEKSIEILERLSTTSRFPNEMEEKLAIVYELNCQNTKAETLLEKIYDSSPQNAYSASPLAWFYIRTKQLAKAQEILKGVDDTQNSLNITTVVNAFYLQKYPQMAAALKETNTSFINMIHKRKTLQVSDFPDTNVLYFCYQYFFEEITGTKCLIDFKAAYMALSEEDRKIWPMPLLGAYGNAVTADQLLSQIATINLQETRMNSCEAYFYLGLLELAKKNKTIAKKYFQLCVDQQILDYVETTGASFFLQTLDQF